MQDRDILIQMCTHIATSIYKGGSNANAQCVADKAFTTSLIILNHINKLEETKRARL